MLDPEVMAAAAPGPLGVAVSGGGDSMALLVLVQEWAAARGVAVRAATVDHGLRAESAGEAARVAAFCAGLGIPHATLTWEPGAEGGNLQARARSARRALLAEWAAAHGVGSVLLGHTRDDVAETFLMRLARGSGVDGLAAMADRWEEAGVTWLRPLLKVGRAELRALLTARGVDWVEDPSNEDPRFDRARMRAALPGLAELGLDAERLAETAEALARARHALERDVAQAARACISERPTGEILISLPALETLPEEIRLRLMSALLLHVGGETYPPRFDGLIRLLDRAKAGDASTLAGCVLRPRGPVWHLRREPSAVAPPTKLTETIVWDGRWRIATHLEGTTVGALGAFPDRGDVPDEVARTLPAVRIGGRIVASPLHPVQQDVSIRLRHFAPRGTPH